ncbi:hypothetical protein ACTA71_009448 [Dictyostelium dimigraforme]
MFHRFGPIFRYKRFRRAQRIHRERVARHQNQMHRREYENQPKGTIENGVVFIDSFNSLDVLSTGGKEIIERSQSPFHQVVKKLYVVSFEDYFNLPVNVDENDLELISNSSGKSDQSQHRLHIKIQLLKSSKCDCPPNVVIFINGKNVNEFHKIKNDSMDESITIYNFSPIDVSQIIGKKNQFSVNALGSCGILMLQVVKLNNFISPFSLI